MRRCAIIADDLTGACDTALQFAAGGYRAALAIDDSALARADVEVLAIDTDSRASAPREAYEQVAQALARVRDAGIDAIYKKVDSTLRGNVGSELQALLDQGCARVILLAPAFPAQGRAVCGGELLVGGRPLATTPFAASLPIATSSVAALVSHTAYAPVVTIDLETVRAGDAAVERAIDSTGELGPRIVAVDAVDVGDLATLAAALARHPTWIAAGSAGLAGAIAALPPAGASAEQRGHGRPDRSSYTASYQSAFKRRRKEVTGDGCRVPLRHSSHGTRHPPNSMLERNLVSGPVLTVVGSMHPSAAEQLAMLAAAGVQQIALRPRALMDDRAAEVARAVAAIRPALASGADMILALDRSERLRDASLPDRALAAALGEVVAELAPMLGGLVVTGGDTAAAVLLRLGAQSADILAEVRPGMPALVVRGGVCAGLPVVTKSGGFGAAQALLDAHYFLKGGDV